MGPLTFTGTGEEIYIDHTRSNVEWFAKEMIDLNVKAEMEVYSLTMMQEVENLISKDLVTKPYLINFVLSVKAMGALEGSPENLMTLKSRLPPDSVMELTAIGKDQLPLTTMAAILGGHIRVGMEDNIYYRKGELAASNAQFVERTVRIVQELEMEPASPKEAKAILGID
jgi:3-keto-5-aminohexanoate cleavage enzyme